MHYIYVVLMLIIITYCSQHNNVAVRLCMSDVNWCMTRSVLGYNGI